MSSNKGRMLLKHVNQYALYSCFKVGGFDINVRQRSGTLRTPKTDASESLFAENPSQTQK
uniref:Transposase n=1 Tax=Heterorhabditis bacteriophora TaxID=37862 RepID=A0A1I7W7B3_HETBA